jgi:hypothetical protein
VSIYNLMRRVENGLMLLGNQFGAPTRTQDQRMLSKEGKMEKSFLNFKVRTFLHHVLVHLVKLIARLVLR